MPIVSLVVVLIVIGVLLWLVNTQLASVMDSKIVHLINVLVVVVVVLWLLQVFGLLGDIRAVRVE